MITWILLLLPIIGVGSYAIYIGIIATRPIPKPWDEVRDEPQRCHQRKEK